MENSIILEDIRPGNETGVYRIRLFKSAGPGEAAEAGGLDLIISEAYLPPEYQRRFLNAGASVPAEAEEAFCFSQFCLAAERTALRLIARAEQCEAGLSRKLEQRKHGGDAVRAVLSRLTRMNLVNDERYAALWLKFRVNHGSKSPRLLVAALRAKGIDQDTAREALEQILSQGVEEILLGRFLKKDRRARMIRSRQGLRSLLRAEGFSPSAVDSFESVDFTGSAAFVERGRHNGEETSA